MSKTQLRKKAKDYKRQGLNVFAFIHDFNCLVKDQTQTRELGRIFFQAKGKVK